MLFDIHMSDIRAEVFKTFRQPSEKLCVDLRYVWCRERQSIQDKYLEFSRWVTDRDAEWYKVQ